MRLAPLLVLLFAFSSPLLASDGVLEINQACATQTGCFPGDTAGYPVTITEAGTSYLLTSKLVIANAVTTAIQVQTNDVSIDLNNFAIILSFCDGATTNCTPLAGTGFGVVSVPMTNRGISVRNGSIVGMGSHGVQLGVQSEVANLRSRWNRFDGIEVNGGSTVANCVTYQNGRNGIRAGSGSTIADNTAYQNGDDGIFGSNGSIITGNASYNNGDQSGPATEDGIQCGAGCLVRANTVMHNDGYGLFLADHSAYSDNVIVNNDTGTVTGPGNTNSRGGNYCAGTGTGSSFCP